jgi:hypothetical protein
MVKIIKMGNIEDKQYTVESYYKKMGIDIGRNPNDTQKYLNLSQEELKKLSPDECSEAAILLANESFFLQREISRLKALIGWATTSIDYMISEAVKDCTGYLTGDQKRVLCIRYNEKARECQAFIVNAQLQLDSISYLPGQLHSVSNNYVEMAKTKRNLK